MTKFNDFIKYDFDEIPDEFFQRVIDLNTKLIPVIIENSKHEDPNIILSALGRIYASLIKYYVSDDIKMQRKAARIYANLLIDTIENFNRKKTNG